MSYRLFLDDERDPPREPRRWRDQIRRAARRFLGLPTAPDVEPWVIVRSYEAAIATITARGLPDYASFDNDLGADADGQPLPTGYDVAKWIGEYVLDHDADLTGFTWYVHSQNPVGARQIDAYLTNLKDFVGRARSAP